MQKGDATFLKRKVISGSLDIHPTEPAIIVNYEVEATILGELGDPMLGERKECQKIIRVRSVNANTDIPTLARQIISQCDLIHPEKLPEVEQLLYYLQKRQEEKRGSDTDLTESPTNAVSPSESVEEIARVTDVDEYVELLYEDIPDKIRGSSLLLQLTRNPDNLEELASSETVLGALTRVLREDFKRSIELSTNILYIFFCFSVFNQFHGLITQHKIGSLCMEVIDYELRRHDQWKEDVEKKRRHSDVTSDGKQVAGEYEKCLKRYHSLSKKQEQMLRVGFYLLLNIAEDPKTEDKMRRKYLVGYLIKSLERENLDLLTLLTTFLKKLSIYVENKDTMAEMNVIEKIPRLLNTNYPDLVNVCLRLLFNLSFDPKLRSRMVRVGLLPKLVSFLSDERHLSPAIGLLYHLSMEDKCKSMFTYTDCIPIVMKMVLECKEKRVGLEVMALCINLAANKRNAQLICEGNGLCLLLRRAFMHEDPLVMKMVRNISQHEGPTKTMFVEFVGDLANAVQEADNEEFVLECIGTLGNLSIPDLDYERLLKEYDLVLWLQNRLVPATCEDDLMLEVVVLLGTVSADEGCAMLLCKADILVSLIELLKARQEDDEMVLQIIYVFYQLCRHDSTRGFLVKETDAAAYLIDLLHDRNVEIRKVCDSTLDIIAEHNPEWAQRIQLEKFRHHNSQWLDMVEGQSMEDIGAYGIADDDFVNFHSYMDDEDLLDRTDLYQADAADFRDDYGQDSRSMRNRARYSLDLEEQSAMAHLHHHHIAHYEGRPSSRMGHRRPSSGYSYNPDVPSFLLH